MSSLIGIEFHHLTSSELLFYINTGFFLAKTICVLLSGGRRRRFRTKQVSPKKLKFAFASPVVY